MSTAAPGVPHTFVVPAFGEPRWLDRCLSSLHLQTSGSPIVVTTSTPTRKILDAAARYDTPVIVNSVSGGIATDWNFALRQVSTEWVSLAHQDDCYEPTYAESCLAQARLVTDPILVFCAAYERFALEDSVPINQQFKRLLCGVAFLGRRAITSRFNKRLLLSFGNPIPCPAVMLNLARLPGFQFPCGWQSNLDWKAWLGLASQPGAFVYVRAALVRRTLHSEAATTRALQARATEDDVLLHELWPRPVSTVVSWAYRMSHSQYTDL